MAGVNTSTFSSKSIRLEILMKTLDAFEMNHFYAKSRKIAKSFENNFLKKEGKNEFDGV